MLNDDQKEILIKVFGDCNIDDLVGWVLSTGFEPGRYLADHVDLQQAGLDHASALCHFLTFGASENRAIRCKALPSGIKEFLSLAVHHSEQKTKIARLIYNSQSKENHSTQYMWSHMDRDLVESLHRAKAIPYFVVGDSHSHLYNRSPVFSTHWWAPMMLLCSGGSAGGLANKQSRSGYGENVLRWAKNVASQDLFREIPIFVKFGQVDVEFVWNFQRIRREETQFSLDQFNAFSMHAAGKYLGFLEQLKEIVGSKRLRICSIFPPVLTDSAWAEGYVNAHIGFLEGDRELKALESEIRGLEIPGIEVRTRLHAIFNAHLHAGCSWLGLTFVDDFTPLLNENGVVDQRYFQEFSGRDHHLDYAPTDRVMVDLIQKSLPYAPA